VLSIAGTDPTGGAGIQADLKSIGANGGYGMAVVTALVAQNTLGVRSVHTPPAAFLQEQLNAVSDDVAIDAVKIGMLGSTEVTDVVRGWLQKVRPAVVVLDPVMVATSGDRLLEPDAESALRALVPLADLVTPNLPELAVLVDEPAAGTWTEALEQGRKLSRATGTAVLVKGGHLDGKDCPDALVDVSGGLGAEVHELTSVRVDTPNTHGTGCSLSSAMATVQARTGNWVRTLAEVKQWLQGALERSDELEVGRGHGPIHHFHAAHSQPAFRPFSEIAGE
jgi:hydroxymethylpyrimidine/phosphomethylpyrimidine kinase